MRNWRGAGSRLWVFVKRSVFDLLVDPGFISTGRITASISLYPNPVTRTTRQSPFQKLAIRQDGFMEAAQGQLVFVSMLYDDGVPLRRGPKECQAKKLSPC